MKYVDVDITTPFFWIAIGIVIATAGLFWVSMYEYPANWFYLLGSVFFLLGTVYNMYNTVHG